jgi:hypothetical protein
MRRHHDPDPPRDPVRRHLGDGVRDERRRVLHPQVRPEGPSIVGQPLDQTVRLRPRRVQQGEHVPDRRVPVAKFL